MTKVEKAADYFKNGCNCAQAVFAAFADECGLDEEQALRIACGLGGGVGRMREVCGAVSAAAMIIGYRHGPDKAAAYPEVQAFCKKFKEQAGSLVCRDLLKGAVHSAAGGAPAQRTVEYYENRPCLGLVKLAASLL